MPSVGVSFSVESIHRCGSGSPVAEGMCSAAAWEAYKGRSVLNWALK